VLAVFIGVVAALIFGSADFAGGMAAKRINTVCVTAIGGITGSLAVVLLWTCRAIGPMSSLSPLTAMISVVVPVLPGVIRGERLETLRYVALVAVLASLLIQLSIFMVIFPWTIKGGD
jgi:hypothetical protein